MNLSAYAYWNKQTCFRTGTLLVAGNKDRVVGNVVMKNPGSSRPLEDTSSREDGRLEFSVDATMHAIAELFELDKTGGTVQIFNLSDVREADYHKAKNLFTDPVESDSTVQDILYYSYVPTYLGWGDMYKDSRFHDKAYKIFCIARKETACYKDNMEENPFFHPLYLMRYGKSKPECQDMIKAFRNELSHYKHRFQ